MPESPLVQIETIALADLEALIASRYKTETETEIGFRKRVDREEAEYKSAAKQLVGKFKGDLQALESQYEQAKQQVAQSYARDTQTANNDYAQAKKEQDDLLRKDQKRAKKAKDETGWQALAVFEGSRDEGTKWRRSVDSNWTHAIAEYEAKKAEVEYLLGRLGSLARHTKGTEAPVEPVAADTPPPEIDDETSNPLTRLQAMLVQIEEEFFAAVGLKLPRFLRPEAFIWPFLLLGAGVAGGLGTVIGWTPAGIVGGVAAIAAGVGGWIGLSGVARPRVLKHAIPLRRILGEADALLEEHKDWIKIRYEAKIKELERRREEKVREADTILGQRMEEYAERHRKATAEIEEQHPIRLEELRVRRDDQARKVEEHYPPRIAALKQKYETDRRALDESYKETQRVTKDLYEKAWAALIANWTEGMGRLRAAVDHVHEEDVNRYLDWNRPDLENWKPPTTVPPGLRFGMFSVDLSQFPNGVPTDPRLKSVALDHFDLPALLPFPIQGSMLIKAADQGKAEAVSLLQSLMLRFSTSVPAGKVRYTIIDPVGLGENFAAFMVLSDYHELLVTNRIWTESAHIEQRLTDLTEHMENVIQKYLRNEFETIEEYNTMAGEVAEPFRVVVVANFPNNFNDNALRRLQSIVASGARCGVYALIMMDSKLSMPSGISIKDFETHCVNMTWREGKFSWKEPNLGRYPLALDSPPESGRFREILHKVGVAARDANRVEVPFEFIAPKPEQFWTFSAAKGVDIPLGRAGATKLQHFKLGRGTSQHSLIAGKTGSGKSTLLHALITNGALRYDPDELELYLIDFKKGVEFKVYATSELPHARVIAVESEREFGLSVLQRLDVELKERGEIYRQLGVQDLAGYREARPEVPMPRILLVVDEFQEFFVEDDKIAQEVTLLLDRLVRQGRAFGMHVNLGSQTLGGAYSLPRATLGNMAVRIALQCSESDAHLILSEDNTAARLLTRPGEAIYNDANGMMEGNNLFQVVWLTDERRVEYLEMIREMNRVRGFKKPPPIVFEGNLPAEVSKNPILNPLLERPDWPEPAQSDHAWLGDAIAIKDPTEIVFRPQSGSNALFVGQNDEAALAMLMMAVIGIAAQHPPAGPGTARFYLLDGSPVDSSLAGKLGQLAKVLPHPVANVTWRDLGAKFAEIAAEMERRQTDSSVDLGPIYVVIHDVQRFRDLRKGDDDFGYSRYDENKPIPPSKIFGDMLRDGPPLGVHTLIWCDSVNNLNRTFDRQGTKEFENRVLFQMSANDSSTLIDTPAASKQGENRALYYSEEANRTEKFRPYTIPEPEWLEKVRLQFASRPMPKGATPAPVTAPSHEPSNGVGNGILHDDAPNHHADEPGFPDSTTIDSRTSDPSEDLVDPAVEAL